MGKKKLFFQAIQRGFDPSKYIKFATIRNHDADNANFYLGMVISTYSSRLLYAVQRDTNTVIAERSWNTDRNYFKINTSLADPYDATIDLYYDLDFQPNVTQIDTSISLHRYYELEFYRFPNLNNLYLRYQSVALFKLSGLTKLEAFKLSNHRVAISFEIDAPINSLYRFTLSNGAGTNTYPDWTLLPNILYLYCYKFVGSVGYINVLTKLKTVFIGLIGSMPSQDMSTCTALYDVFLRSAGTPELGNLPALTKWGTEDCTGYFGGSTVLDVSDKPSFNYFKIRGGGSNYLDPNGITTSFKEFSSSKRAYNHEPLLQKIYDLGTTNGKYTKSTSDSYTAAEQLLVDELTLRGWTFNSI